MLPSYLLGEKRLEQKLDTLKENMKSEHSLRELSDPGIQVVDTFYHRIEGYHITGNLLIFASYYQSLKKDSNRLFYIQQIGIDASCYRLFYNLFDNGELRNFIP